MFTPTPPKNTAAKVSGSLPPAAENNGTGTSSPMSGQTAANGSQKPAPKAPLALVRFNSPNQQFLASPSPIATSPAPTPSAQQRDLREPQTVFTPHGFNRDISFVLFSYLFDLDADAIAAIDRNHQQLVFGKSQNEKFCLHDAATRIADAPEDLQLDYIRSRGAANFSAPELEKLARSKSPKIQLFVAMHTNAPKQFFNPNNPANKLGQPIFLIGRVGSPPVQITKQTARWLENHCRQNVQNRDVLHAMAQSPFLHPQKQEHLAGTVGLLTIRDQAYLPITRGLLANEKVSADALKTLAENVSQDDHKAKHKIINHPNGDSRSVDACLNNFPPLAPRTQRKRWDLSPSVKNCDDRDVLKKIRAKHNTKFGMREVKLTSETVRALDEKIKQTKPASKDSGSCLIQ